MKYEFKGNFLYYVRLVKRLNERMLAQAAGRCGISVQEADVLLFLRENPEFDTARDVALYREVSRAYVSNAVELLAARGYLTTAPNKDDRRLQHLKITDKAKFAADILHAAQFDFYDKITSSLTDNEIRLMLSLLEKCADEVIKNS